MSLLESKIQDKRFLKSKRKGTSHDLPAFFIMAYAFSWLAVLPLLLSRNELFGMPPDLPVEPFLILGAFAGPNLAAYILTALRNGRSGIRQLLSRYIQWRIGVQWYLLIIFAPLIALTLGAIPFLGTAIVSAFIENIPLLPSIFLPTLIIGVILGPLWEEPGWRGFALPRLQNKYGPLLGTFILGILWALWHLPGFFGGWLGTLSASSFTAMLVGTIASAFILTWVYNNTGGSLLIMILLHSSFNAAISFGGHILPTNVPADVAVLVNNGWIPALTYTLWAMLIIAITRGRLSHKPAQNDELI